MMLQAAAAALGVSARGDTQLVLLQEAELNAHACQWLHAFCADRPEVSSAGGGGGLVAQHGTLA